MAELLFALATLMILNRFEFTFLIVGRTDAFKVHISQPRIFFPKPLLGSVPQRAPVLLFQPICWLGHPEFIYIQYQTYI